ncbi:hypothetical protein RB595_010685 [Gaeumannomyces hyphopodioides]
MSNNRKRGRDNTSPQRSESTRPARIQPPRLITSALTPDRFASSPLQRVPTPDSQNVYNTMRDAAMADRLAAPSVRSATMSRSPSATSSNSLNNGMDDLRVQEPPSPNTRKQKRQPKRKGPLTETAKTKAAFLRRIGACSDCRGRKVTCHLSHHDLKLFEQGYMERGHLPQGSLYNRSSPPGPPFIDLSGLLPIHGPPSVPGFPPPSNLPQDLLGVGGDSRCHQPSAPPQHVVSAELDAILWEERFDASAVSPVTAVSPASPMLQNRLVSPTTPEALGGRQLFNPLSRLPSPTVSLPAARSPTLLFGSGDVAQQPDCVPIGRLVGDLGLWECQGGGHQGGGPPSVVSSTNASTVPDVCLRNLASLKELLRHYELEHGRYQYLENPFMYKCSGCQFLSPLAGLQQCPSCDRTLVSGLLSWEEWYYVSMLRPASLAAERITSVPSGAGLFSFQFSGNSSSGFSPSTQQFNGSGGHSNWLHPPQQYYPRADGRGRQRKNKDGGGSASEKDRDDVDSEPWTTKSACPFRQLVPATLEPMCSPVDNKTCGWRQPSRSRSRPCMPSPRGSSCPLSAAGRPAAALLLAVGRWLLPLLLVAFLLCVFALSSPASTASASVGDVDVLGSLSRTLLHNWVLLAAGGLLGTWLLSTVGAGASGLGRLRMGENAGVAAPNLVAGVV